MPRPIFFLHIPKTAGTTVNEFLASLYDAPSAQHIEMHTGWKDAEFWLKYPFISGHVYLDEVRGMVPKSFLFLTFLRDPWKQFLSAIKYNYAICAQETKHKFEFVGPRLRNFSESMHAINIENPREFETWLSQSGDIGNRMTDNFQTRHLASVADSERTDHISLEKAINGLRSFEGVGIVERMEESIRMLGKIAKFDTVPNLTMKTLNRQLVSLPGLESPEIKEICQPLIQYDQKLYEFANKLLTDRGRFIRDKKGEDSDVFFR